MLPLLYSSLAPPRGRASRRTLTHPSPPPGPQRHTLLMRRWYQSVDMMKWNTATHAATIAATRMSGITATRIMGLKLP